MKKILLISITIVLAGCWGDESWWEGSSYTPVLMERSVLEASITYLPPRKVTDPGKIYTYQDYIFINEKFSGVHVIDNTNPESPERIGFIRIPGNVDIAVKNDVLYADNAVDLISIDISSMDNLQILSRNTEAFPELTPPDLDYVPYNYDKDSRPENTIIIKWEAR